MKVLEIFSSIQGEGCHLGIPSTFVRFMGCNLHCSFCDTKETWNDQLAQKCYKEMSVVEILDECVNYNNKHVVLTGGEPCLQADLAELVHDLKRLGFYVCIETNGTLPTPPELDWVTCSPKEDAQFKINEGCRVSELKFVVTPDFNAEAVITPKIREEFANVIWLQPEGSQMQEMWQKAIKIALADPRLRVGVQLHKLMEVK